MSGRVSLPVQRLRGSSLGRPGVVPRGSVTRPIQRPRGASVAAQAGRVDLVKDVMTTGALFTCKPDDSVDSALETLVQQRITGLPVVDGSNVVIGVVSDFDLLALDALGRTQTGDLFPQAETTWQAFKEVKTLVAKTAGKCIKDVMTKKPITVSPDTSLNDATKLLLTKKIHRLPVVDGDGKLVGLLSRGNIVKAALKARKEASASMSEN